MLGQIPLPWAGTPPAFCISTREGWWWDGIPFCLLFNGWLSRIPSVKEEGGVITETRHDEEGGCPSLSRNGNETMGRGIPLLIALNGNDMTGERHVPPRHIEIVTIRLGRACPSSLHSNGNDMKGRGIPLLIASKWQQHDEEGYTPPHCMSWFCWFRVLSQYVYKMQ